MNNKPSITYLILIIAPFFFGCRGPTKQGDEKNELTNPVSRGQKYIIDTKESVLTWEGSMVFGFEEEHIGYVYTSKGELMIEKDSLVGGTAKIDMKTPPLLELTDGPCIPILRCPCGMNTTYLYMIL